MTVTPEMDRSSITSGSSNTKADELLVNKVQEQSTGTITDRLNDEILRALGPGPAMFGPAKHPMEDNYEYNDKNNLTAAQIDALEKIRQRAATLKPIQQRNKQKQHNTPASVAFLDRQICQVAAYKHYHVEKTIKMLRRIDARQLNVTAAELRQQLLTCTLFPLPRGVKAKHHSVQDLFYMRPSRYFPSQTTARTIITNLIYVMETLRDRQQQQQRSNDSMEPNPSRIGFIANMKDWKMENFAVDYCQQFMYALQGYKAAVHVDLFLIVNPPGWFDRIWYIMKPMLAESFRRKVHMISESQLKDFLAPGFGPYLPNEFESANVGQANATQLVHDFIAFREYYENVTGVRTPSQAQAALLVPPRRELRKQQRQQQQQQQSRRTITRHHSLRRGNSGSVASGSTTQSAGGGGGGGSSSIADTSSCPSSNHGEDEILSFSDGDDFDEQDWTQAESSQGHRTGSTSSLASIKQVTERFGPGVPPRALEDAVRRLSPQRSGAFFAIRDKMDQLKLPYPFSDAQILRVAGMNGFYVDRTVQALKRMDACKLNITAQELQPQLATMCLFPLSNGISSRGDVKDFFYMRPSRYFPAKTRCRTIISNLIYVMDSIYERYRDPNRKMGFVANMDDWTMENFSVSYCKQFMYALQGKIAPSRVDLFLIVNPPGWFDKIWNIMKPMLAVNFRKKVYVIPQSRLREFFNEGFEEHIPNEFAGIGQASVPQLVKDFVAFRKHHERTTGARMPRAEQTALMMPPRRVSRQLAKERKKKPSRQSGENAHAIEQIEVEERSVISSHVSFDSAEDDEDFDQDLGEDELNEGFEDSEGKTEEIEDEDTEKAGVELDAVEKRKASDELPQNSWHNMQLPSDSGHGLARFGGYTSHPAALLDVTNDESDLEDSFSQIVEM